MTSHYLLEGVSSSGVLVKRLSLTPASVWQSSSDAPERNVTSAKSTLQQRRALSHCLGAQITLDKTITDLSAFLYIFKHSLKNPKIKILHPALIKARVNALLVRMPCKEIYLAGMGHCC